VPNLVQNAFTFTCALYNLMRWENYTQFIELDILT
jgi:hypothetical protein